MIKKINPRNSIRLKYLGQVTQNKYMSVRIGKRRRKSLSLEKQNVKMIKQILTKIVRKIDFGFFSIFSNRTNT